MPLEHSLYDRETNALVSQGIIEYPDAGWVESFRPEGKELIFFHPDPLDHGGKVNFIFAKDLPSDILFAEIKQSDLPRPVATLEINKDGTFRYSVINEESRERILIVRQFGRAALSPNLLIPTSLAHPN